MSLLGIDLGTSGIKCVAYNEDGRMLGKTYREYHLFMPEEGVVELDAMTVWDNLMQSLKELNSFDNVIKDPVRALSISVSADEGVPADKDGTPLYNVIMAMDKRGEKENRWINDLVGSEKIYSITGQPPSNLYPLNKIIWFKKNKPEIYKKIDKFLCWEEFVFKKFGVEPVTDYSIACRSLAFDIVKKEYSAEILNKLDVDINILPETAISGTDIGVVDTALAQELGFKDRIQVITGGFDQICAALGSGVVKSGMASVGTGTMEIMQICFDKPVLNSKMMNYGYPFCNHAIEDLYITLSINYCGGVIFKWYRDNFSHNEREISEKTGKNLYDVIMDLAQDSMSPVQFLPYFEGAQTPRNNPDISGAVIGMTLRTTREDLIKGMFEGITFDLKLNLEKMEETGIKIDTLRATGGGARSDTWLQIKADITGKLIQKIDVDESGCMAAAVLAGYGTGMFGSVKEAVEDWVKIGKEFEPDRSKYDRYAERYDQWLGIYEKLKEIKIIN